LVTTAAGPTLEVQATSALTTPLTILATVTVNTIRALTFVAILLISLVQAAGIDPFLGNGARKLAMLFPDDLKLLRGLFPLGGTGSPVNSAPLSGMQPHPRQMHLHSIALLSLY
jgi:hypothetical protein